MDVLHERLQVYLDPQPKYFRPDALLAREKICLALERLGTRDEAFRVATNFGIAPSTMSKHFNRVMELIHEHFRYLSVTFILCACIFVLVIPTFTPTVFVTRNEISLPNSAEMKEISQWFKANRCLPNCIGAIDGKHFQTIA